MNTNNANEALARQIVDKLLAARLIRADDREGLVKQLAAGTLKENDWRAVLLPHSTPGGIT